jgi:DNA replication protein DnaC
MNTPIERLHTALETLGLKAVEARLENLLEQASKKEPSYADFLDELLNCEVEARRTRYMRAKLQLAHLPFVKTFEQFDFSFQPSIDERQIRELRSLRFIHEASNVIFLGPPGVGKTHLSVALAEAAIRSGLGAYFITAHDLAADLGQPTMLIYYLFAHIVTGNREVIRILGDAGVRPHLRWMPHSRMRKKRASVR